ncbi:MAG: hypothetical protein J0H50_10585 [Xanthomonadales bacterium]|nr:hypothetical protein [Xanthomonadales bacterium]
MTKRYPDETLNHWADIYVARNVRGHGISLEAFLAYPHQMLDRVERIEAREFPEPKLHRCERRMEHSMRQRGAILIQKLWHGSRKRNRADAPLPSRR